MRFERVEEGARRETREGVEEVKLEERCCGSEREEGGEVKEVGRLERCV